MLINSFILSCINCAIDNWKCIRDFIDIERLSRKIPRAKIIELSKRKLIKKSVEIGFFLTESPYLNFSNNYLTIFISKNNCNI